MDFKDSEKINVTKHIEKKGKFSYLSWPFAVSEFRKACPNGTWQVRSFGDNQQPYCQTDAGCFVEIEVYPDLSSTEHPASAISFTQVHPVLDNRNNTLAEPNAFQINTSIQRCLVKAIALATGIGLHIYAGEDLPPSETQDKGKEKFDTAEKYNALSNAMQNCTNQEALNTWLVENAKAIKELSQTDFDRLKASKESIVEIFKEEADNAS